MTTRLFKSISIQTRSPIAIDIRNGCTLQVTMPLPLTGRRQKELNDAVKALGSNVYGVQGDVAKLG